MTTSKIAITTMVDDGEDVPTIEIMCFPQLKLWPRFAT